VHCVRDQSHTAMRHQRSCARSEPYGHVPSEVVCEIRAIRPCAIRGRVRDQSHTAMRHQRSCERSEPYGHVPSEVVCEIRAIRPCAIRGRTSSQHAPSDGASNMQGGRCAWLARRAVVPWPRVCAHARGIRVRVGAVAAAAGKRVTPLAQSAATKGGASPAPSNAECGAERCAEVDEPWHQHG